MSGGEPAPGAPDAPSERRDPVLRRPPSMSAFRAGDRVVANSVPDAYGTVTATGKREVAIVWDTGTLGTALDAQVKPTDLICVARVTRRNGAWLVFLPGHRVPDYDAAGTLRVAKEVAEAHALRGQLPAPYVWHRLGGVHMLHARRVDRPRHAPQPGPGHATARNRTPGTDQ